MWGPQLRSLEEHAEWLAAARERNARLQREQVAQYARAHIAPRLDFGERGDSALPRLRPLPERPGAGGLSPINRHILAGGAAFAPVLVLVALIGLFKLTHANEPPALPRSIVLAPARPGEAVVTAQLLPGASPLDADTAARLEKLEAELSALKARLVAPAQTQPAQASAPPAADAKQRE